jgi:hypothetical protein
MVRELVLPNFYDVETASWRDVTGVHIFPQMAERCTYVRYVTLIRVSVLETYESVHQSVRDNMAACIQFAGIMEDKNCTHSICSTVVVKFYIVVLKYDTNSLCS